MFINDCIENVSLQKELENVKEQLKAVQDENAKLKTTIELHYKVYGAENLEKDERLSNDQINISDEDWLKYRLSNKEGKIKVLEAKIEMLENDRKDSLKDCCECSHKFQARIKDLKDEISKLSEEKQQEGDNLRNRIKDLEAEIDQLKSNSSAVSYSELLAIHTADVETINNLNIKVRDLNSTISTLIERASKSGEENQELKKRVQQLKYIIEDLNKKLYE